MKKQVKNQIWQMGIIIGSLFVSSACILFVPAAHNQKVPTMICSTIFWVTLLIGYVLLFLVDRFRRKQQKKKGKQHPGAFCFFQNRIAAIADGVWILSFLAWIISGRVQAAHGYLQYVLVFLFLFSLHMHCICNGVNFQYMQNEIRRGLK